MEKIKNLVALTTKKSLYKVSKTKAIAAMVILTFGISMITTALILDNVIQTKIDASIAEQISVPNSRDEAYDEWVSNKDKDAIPFYTKYSIWNLTNPAGYLSGNKPVYEEIGPYVFREYTTKYNVKYSDNKEEVSYNSYTNYEFDQGRSGELSLNDNITNINPGYLGVLNLTKTEKGLVEMMAPIILSTVKTLFETIYYEQVNIAMNSFLPVILQLIRDSVHFPAYGFEEDYASCANVILGRIRDYLMQPGFAERAFYEEWANNRFPDVPSSIFYYPEHIFLKLYIPIGIPIWPDISDSLASQCGYIMSEAHNVIDDNADIDGREPYNCKGKTNDLTICTAEHPEAIFPLTLIQKIWNSSDMDSLVGTNSSCWWKAVNGDDDAKLFLKNHFSMTDDQLNKTTSWLLLSRDCKNLGNQNKGWLANISVYEIEHMNSGLLTTRTVEEWLFEAEDNLIKQVYPELAKVNLFDNCLSETDAILEGTDRYTIKTGKNNCDEAKETVEYNGEEEISMWASDIDVKGTDGTQFSPGLTIDDDILEVFVSELVRPVDFKLSKLTELYDIKLYRYKFSEEVFEPASEYYMDTNGLAFMYPKYGIPVYLSKPHFLGADPSVFGAVSGMKADSTKHDTYIDVEPITGITMNAKARLQVNFKVTPTDKWYTNVSEVYMPILWVAKEAEIPEEKAEEFKESLYEALELRRTLIPAVAGLGALMTVIGAMFSYTTAVKRKKAKVKRVKEKYGGNQLLKQPPISK